MQIYKGFVVAVVVVVVVVVAVVVVVVVVVIKACSNPWLGLACIFRNWVRLGIPSYLGESTCGPI